MCGLDSQNGWSTTSIYIFRNAHGRTMIHTATKVTWKSHSNLIVAPRRPSHGSTMEASWVRRCHGNPMEFFMEAPWKSHRSVVEIACRSPSGAQWNAMDTPLQLGRSTTDVLFEDFRPHRSPLEAHPWKPRGIPLSFPWKTRGSSMEVGPRKHNGNFTGESHSANNF